MPANSVITETTPFGRVETHHWGEGSRTLVLLHASATGPWAFAPLAEMLVDGGWRCIAPALHGYGESRVDGATDLLAAHVDITRWSIRSAGARCVFGHSMGGLAALLAAPGQALDRLILFEPILFAALDPVPDANLIAREQAMGRTMADHLAAGRLEDAVRTFVERWNDAAWADLPPTLHRRLTARAAAIVAETQSVGEAAIGPEVWHAAPPTILLHGDRSPEIARRMAIGAVARMPEACVVPLAGVGHMGPLMTPEPLAVAILDALR